MSELVYGMPFKDYRQHPSVANSDLTQIAKSPAHYQFYKQNPKDETAALLFGRALHKLLLEPDSFNNEYVFAPEFNKRTKEGKAQLEAFVESNKEKDVLSDDIKTELYNTVEAIKNNDFVKNILGLPSGREVSLFWKDTDTGADCKGRADLILPDNDIIIDIKSSRDAGLDYFSKALFDYRYFVQAAYYSDGYEAITGKRPQFCFIVFEKEAPYGVMTYLIDQRAISAGREVYRRDLATYKKCSESGIWEGYPQKIVDIDMPEWVYKKLQNEGIAA